MALTESNTDQFSLQQRYEAAPKQILATGIQALVRLPIDLMRADRAKGWNTAAFISGYQGSPLGGYDRELQSQRKLLDEFNIVHVPGLNEELAATSVFGSQTAQTYAKPKYEGVAGHLVRQVTRPRSRRRRDSSWQLRGYGSQGWRRAAGRRRCCGQVVDASVAQRPHARRAAPAGLLPGHRAGCARSRHPRLRHVAAHRSLGGDEDHHARRRRLGDGRGVTRSLRPGAARLRGRRQAVGADAQWPRRRSLRQHARDRGARQPHRMGQALRRGEPDQHVRHEPLRRLAGHRRRRPRHAAGDGGVARARSRAPSGSASSASAS